MTKKPKPAKKPAVKEPVDKALVFPKKMSTSYRNTAIMFGAGWAR